LSSKEVKFIVNANSRAAYDPSGYLMFVREQSLMAQPFDAGKLQATGDAFPVAEQLQYNAASGGASFGVSLNSVLTYRTGSNLNSTRLMWFDRSGKPLGVLGPIGNQRNPELSPDGRRVAIERSNPPNRDIWIVEVERGVTTRLTFDPGDDFFPIWSPDGAQILFSSYRKIEGLYTKPSTGAGTDQLLLNVRSIARDWSPDGKFVVYTNVSEIWSLPLFGERKPVLYLKSQLANLSSTKLSPDGRWVAYTSTESGNNEIYVQNFPNPSAKWQISTEGGNQARWRRDSKEIFYIATDQKLMAVPVRATATALEPSTPIPLFDVRVPGGAALRQQYDVTPDGQRFLVNTVVDEAADTPITVVLNWLASVRK
jgi:dipeptidyl aminopeptidase/acylaminoacyl peptidase